MRLLAIALGAACLTSAATAMPPPVPVDPIAVVEVGHGQAAEQLVAALKRLGSAGYAALRSTDIQTLEVSRECALNGKCVSLPPAAPVGRVLVIAVDPHWHPSDHQVRCVGPDPTRAQVTRVYLYDAASKAPEIAQRELTKLASCMIAAAGPR